MYKSYTYKLGITQRCIRKIWLIMRLTTVILILFLMQVSAASFGQRITINERNAPFKKVLNKIHYQSGYNFLFDVGDLSTLPMVNISVKNVSVEEVMDRLLKNQSLTYVIDGKTILLKVKEKTLLDKLGDAVMTIDVRGTVVDENGEPLQGAVVRIIGTSKETITNSNGEFTFTNIDEKSKLSISFVGYQKKELSATSKLDRIVMVLSSEALGDVVISTGIFKKADKSFTGSSITVTAKELRSFGTRNMIVSLRNIDPSFNIIDNNVMGSDPNRLPDIQIRGNSSLPNVDSLDDLAGLNTPLVILDGFESTLQKMLDMNVNEVESITILKDASATAIYGSRGSNGVIVITTILPEAGSLRVSYSADLNLEVADLSDYHVLDARQKLELERKAGLYNNNTIPFDLQLKRYYNYLLNEINSGVDTYWLDMPLQTGVGQRHNFGVSGGDNTFRYSGSVQLNNIKGAMKGSERNTFNGTVNLAYRYRKVKFSNQLMVSEGRSSESPYGQFSSYVQMNPYWRAFDEKGEALKFLGDPGTDDYTIRWNSLPTNPLYNATLNVYDETKLSELTNNSSIEWSLSQNLVIRAQLGLTKSIRQTDKFRPAAHTAFANYSSTDIFRKGDYNYGIGNGFRYDGGLNVQYSNTFREKHTFFGGLDFNIRHNENSFNNFLVEGFTNPNFDFISMALQYAKDQKPSGTESLTNALGATANINYIYDNRFFTDGSLRIDGASQFGTNNRVAPFWSLGLGWNLHNEAFLIDNKFIDRLKIRGSMGITGSQNFDAYQALSTYRYYTDKRYFNLNGAYLLGIGNEDLKWQQALKIDVGFDAELLKARIKVTGDYYVATTRDLVSSIAVPASNGFSSYVENIGKMRNEGFELRATGIFINHPSKGLYWSVSAGVVQNRNKILKVSKALKDAQNGRQMQTGAVPLPLYFEGYSTNSIWVVPSLGIDPSNGKEVYMDINGKPTYVWNGNDLRVMGNSDPDFMGNFSTLMRYKSLSMNASFGYRFGGQAYNQTLISRVENADYKYNVDSRVYNDRWVEPGDNVAFKGLMVSGETYKSSRFVQNENVLTCQNINLQYNLRAEGLKKRLSLDNLTITANLAEPFRFSSVKQERGLSYPFTQQFSLGISSIF